MPKFREISGQFVGYVPDSIDPDFTPDREPMNGLVKFTPVYTGGVIAFPELLPPEFAKPQPIHARIIDGFVRVEVLTGGGEESTSTMQPLYLMVTVDDEATQVWSWRAEFSNITFGTAGEDVEIPSWSFRIPDGVGPIDLTEMLPVKSSATVDVTNGPRGAGLQTITAVDGQLVFAYTDGEESIIDMPDAVQGPEGPEGPRGPRGEVGPQGEKGDPGETPDLLVGNIADATPTGKNLMLAATEGAARNALGLQTGATTIAGAYSELENGTQTNSRVWSPKNISDYVESQVGAAKIVVNVKDYGAVGDGVTDDTAPMQAAIDSVSALGGGEVFVPYSPNPYRISRLYAQSNLTFRSAPGVVLKRKGYTFGIVNLGNDGTANYIDIANTDDGYSGPSGISVIGGTWDCGFSDEPYGSSGYNVFYFTYCRDIEFRDLTVLDVATNHALDMNAVNHLRVTNCKFLGYKDTTPDQSRTAVEAIQLTTGSESDLVGAEDVIGTPCTDVIISGCVFGASTNTDTGAWPTAVGNHGATPPPSGYRLNNNITIENCVVHDATYAAASIYTWDDVVVSGNTFTGCEVGILTSNMSSTRRWNRVTKTWDVGPSRVECGDHQYVDNTFLNCVIGINSRGTGVGADGVWAKLRNISVRGNTIVNDVSGSYAIRFLICGGSAIENNTIRGYSVGVQVESSRSVSIRGNNVSGTTGGAIRVTNQNTPTGGVFTSRDTTIANNSLNTIGTDGVYLNAASGVKIVGNSVEEWARANGAAGITMYGYCDGALISGNYLQIRSNTTNSTGIRVDLATHSETRLTKDNFVRGSTNLVWGLPQTGVTYGEISY